MEIEEFAAILREYDYSEDQIKRLWNTRPKDDLNPELVHETAKSIAPLKDILDQPFK